MWIRIILLILISPDIFVYGKEEGNQSRLLSNGSLKSRIKQLRSPIQIYSINSTYRYVRVLVWYTLPTPKRTKIYFAKFELLKFKEKWLEDHKVDIIKQTESIYERFILVYYPEKQSIVTVFLKLNLENNQKNILINSTIKEVEQALKNYGFIIFNESQTVFTILRRFPLSILLWCIILPPICIVFSVIKLCQKCKKQNVNNSRYIHTENLLNQNAENKSSSENEKSSAKIDIHNLLNENIEIKSRLSNVQNWVDHINEYEATPDSEKKSFVNFDDDVNSFRDKS